MKEDLSLIKRYPIVEYLERKGIKPVRRTPAYALYRSPLREETHPSFKVDTEKNLWIDYAEGRGGSIIDLCMRMERCSLSEAIRLLGRNAPDTTCSPRMVCVHGTSNQESIGQATSANGTRRLTGISDTLPPHLQDYLMKERYIDLAKGGSIIKPSASPISRVAMSFGTAARSRERLPRRTLPLYSWIGREIR